MALNLKNEIDRLNNNKEKTKTVAINIDNRLVELGGNSAKDLNDVPNKIDGVAKQYKKFYKANFTYDGYFNDINTFNLNVGFTVEKIWIVMKSWEDHLQIQDFEVANGTNRQRTYAGTEFTAVLTKESNNRYKLEVKQPNVFYCKGFIVYAIGV